MSKAMSRYDFFWFWFGSTFAKIFALFLALSSSILLGGCAARTYVASSPSGARISVNDHYEGQTPLFIQTPDILGLGSIYAFKAELEGYETQIQVFKEMDLQDANQAIPAQIYFNLMPKLTGSVPPFAKE